MNRSPQLVRCGAVAPPIATIEALILGLFFLFAAAPARAQVVDSTLWVTNGIVEAMATSGSTLYVGGFFDRVSPPSGGGVPFDPTTGSPVANFPKVSGQVFAIAPDGTGGWFLGGAFTAVADVPRANLAHVLADGSVAAWNPGTNGRVHALAVCLDTVFVGGEFSSVGGQTRSGLGSVRASTGNVTAWDPGPSGGFPSTIDALAAPPGVVYVGGDFTSIAGQARNHVAAINPTNGSELAVWNPGADGLVLSLAVSDDHSTVYAAGAFNTLGGATRHHIGAVPANANSATAWDPNADVQVNTLLVSGTRVYAGGGFSNIGGQPRTALAALDATVNTNDALALDAAVARVAAAFTSVSALALSGTTLYVGGSFDSIGGQPRRDLAALDLTHDSNNALAWNPDVNGGVTTLAANGSVVYAGGTYTGVGGVTRTNLAAIDLTSGAPTAWHPDPDGEVYAIAPANGVVYVGGTFNNVGGQFRRKIAAVDPSTGLATAWDPIADSGVGSLLAHGSTIYAGGGFTSIGLQTRHHLAALSAATGLATAWNPNAGDWVLSMALKSDTLFAGGYFPTMGGVSRAGLAAVDTTTGALLPWNPSPNGSTNALAVNGGLVYAGGYFSNIGGATRYGLAALDPATGNATAWKSDAFYSVRAILPGGDALYAGGDFSFIGGQSRAAVAALDYTTGNATIWSPNAEFGSVYTLAATGSTLLAGGTFTGVNGHPQANLVAMGDLTTPALVLRFDAEVDPGGVRLAWRLAPALDAADVVLERAERASGPWTALALAPRVAGDLVEAVDADVEPGRAYWYRLSESTTTLAGPIEAVTPAALTTSGVTRVVPNPAASGTRIDYAVAQREHVRLSVIDVAGREVGVLVDGVVEPGRYSVRWDGGASGATRSPGLCFVRWESPGRKMEKRLVLLR